MRLDGFLANAGLTRTRAKTAVKLGRVTVNGVTARDPSMRLLDGATVELDGNAVYESGHSYIMLNKPSGAVTAQSDGRFKTVFDVLPKDMLVRGLCAVGRLDKDTTGLMLFTTDGELAHRLISPNRAVKKVYEAILDSPVDDDCVKRMAKGMSFKDFIAKPAKMTIISERVATLEITEGKYHQVKRMFAALGRNVVNLKRLSVAGIKLDEGLTEGTARRLTPDEIETLYKRVGLRGAPDE